MNREINRLLTYALRCNLIKKEDYIFCANMLIDLCGYDEFSVENIEEDNLDVDEILNNIMDILVSEGKLENTVSARDLMDTRIMSYLVDRPSNVINKFNSYDNIKDATNYFYNLSIDSNYIRMNRVKKNINFTTPSNFGDIQISINLSKPEKDPKEIKRAREMQTSEYPKCLLCEENLGFAGNLNRDSRKTLRTIPIVLNDEDYFLQYSPYVYYNEHAIIFNKEHKPMKINKDVLIKLTDFVDKFNHYFIGSNADLPIVGGSILSHDHFQGGNHRFSMDDASSFYTTNIGNVDVELLNWPLSTIRLTSPNKEEVIDLANKIFTTWQNYTNEELDITSHTDNIAHNTITPIVRKEDDNYIINVVLRNNRCNDVYPDGIFHPHVDKHHVKKENIGLIEVMGLAILPPRLEVASKKIKDVIINNQEISEEIKPYTDLINEIKDENNYNEDNCLDLIYQKIGQVFVDALIDCGVFKLDDQGKEAFINFVEGLNE